MNFLFRVDSSSQIGSGHLMRCIALAEAIRKINGFVFFICRNLPGNFINIIKENGLGVERLPWQINKDATLDWNYHAAWLETTWQEDADQTLSVINNIPQKFDWIIVDHYALDIQWEKLLRPAIKNIMVIDDLADRHHDCDILLDQNFYGNINSRYESLVSPNCIKLLGPHYAILRQEFFHTIGSLRKRDGVVRRILIFFGGTDLSDETTKTLKALGRMNLKNIVVDVVVGAENPYRDNVYKLCRANNNFEYHCNVNNMAMLMLKADLAIGACGTASWERCFLGLPSLVLTTAKNQVAIAEALTQNQLAIYLGEAGDVDGIKIAQTVNKLLRHPETLMKISSSSRELVDGLGAERILSRLKQISDGC